VSIAKKRIILFFPFEARGLNLPTALGLSVKPCSSPCLVEPVHEALDPAIDDLLRVAEFAETFGD
jgi:hypothetical protein